MQDDDSTYFRECSRAQKPDACCWRRTNKDWVSSSVVKLGPKLTKSVPPTATPNGEEANPLTAEDRVSLVRACTLIPWSQVADPSSPDELMNVIP